MKISTYKIKRYSGKWFFISKNNARNMHLLYQKRQKTQWQQTEADFSGNGRLWRKKQEICSNPRWSSIIIQIGKRWFCWQSNIIYYHGICRTKYQTAAEQISKASKNKKVANCLTNFWHRGREVHSEAFTSICSLVEDQVITDGYVLGLKDGFNICVSILEDLDADNLVASYTKNWTYISKNV